MLNSAFLKKLIEDESGQHAVESTVLIAILVVALASSLSILLPFLGTGFIEMAGVIAGPVP